MTKHIIFIGAGLTSLSCAARLSDSGYRITIFEKEPFPGGLASTLDWDGWKFDYGVHNFYTNDHEIESYFREIFKEHYVERANRVRLYINGRLIAFPLSGLHIFSVLPPLELFQAAGGFLRARISGALFGWREIERLDEWIIQRFGKTLYRIYFGPYLERVQKIDPHFLSKVIGEKKIKEFSIRHLLLQLVFGREVRTQKYRPMARSYLLRGGAGTMASVLAGRILKNERTAINLGEAVRKITVSENRMISLETDRRVVDLRDAIVVSTIPLGDLVRACPSLQSKASHAAVLDYTPMRFFLLKVNRDKVLNYSWISFNDARFPFYRLSGFFHDELVLCPPGTCSLTFELPLNPEDPLWSMPDEELLEKLLPLLNDLAPLRREEILGCKSLYCHHANPRMRVGHQENIRELFTTIQKIEGLYSLGRQGLFTYINSDGCLRMGLDFAQAIKLGHERAKQKDLLFHHHQISLNEH